MDIVQFTGRTSDEYVALATVDLASINGFLPVSA